MDSLIDFILTTLKHPAFHASILASTVAIVGIKKTRQSARDKNSIDFETVYKTNPQLVAAWKLALPIMINSTSSELENISDHFETEKNEAITTILNTWERAANGIFHNIYDGNFLYKTYGTTVLKLYVSLYPFIRKRQSSNHRFYLQLTKLYLCWRIRRQLENKEKVREELQAIYKVLEKKY